MIVSTSHPDFSESYIAALFLKFQFGKIIEHIGISSEGAVITSISLEFNSVFIATDIFAVKAFILFYYKNSYSVFLLYTSKNYCACAS